MTGLEGLKLRRYHLAFIATCLLLTSCATITRPSTNMPLVELQVNNTGTQADDYLGVSARLPARIRIINTFAIRANRAAVLRNFDTDFGGQIRFSNSATSSLATSLNITIPHNGDWVNFHIAGDSRNLSSRDKDAVIEVVENRSDGIVLARTGIQVQSGTGTALSTIPVQIRIGRTDTADDYLTWTPRLASIRLEDGGAARTVRLRNLSSATGRVLFAFQPNTSASPPAPSTMSSSLDLSLPGTGEWVSFYVAGNFGSPSTRDKDAVIEVTTTSEFGSRLARHGVMVRIRKNAGGLRNNERDRFIAALARHRSTFLKYAEFQSIHSVIGNRAHSNATVTTPAFLPWHRIFILRLERELQGIDPSVTLPYWKFDDPAPSVFSANFMGGPPNSSGLATFASGNPLSTWSASGTAGIIRRPDFAPNQDPSGLSCAAVRTDSSTLGLGSTYTNFLGMEFNPHGRAHIHGGGFSMCGGTDSWLTDPATSVRDPLFFLLHTNVDRLWAQWQENNDRFTPTATATYMAQGSSRTGQNLRDTMWPWNTSGVAGGKFPQIPGRFLLPPAEPMPLNSINYHRSHFEVNSTIRQSSIGLGFAYDTIPYAE